ncbi:malto-oligosyltrehalose synthase [Microlunatus panaciterrae]|uniref:(1->4)-alpha-D-glucan 1-alpha-D-glucosylmutase n=1 Tax=Microlunatus panaciterrae TaxID=400768 RepID=A0ABS2RM17_9ACTN|nr:(1->4)-alpha-D-glucan 1-alpha-D-glucosylmutase [Microlunatus panaciterrae]
MTRHPASTYRLQIRPSFTLQQAAEIVDYLAELGVGAVYLSPLLTSTTGSDHGYDTVDPLTIDPARGGEEGWRSLLAAARAAGLDVVVDIVPNHLGVAVPAENPAWWDVLKHGRDSAYADWFDIDWSRRILLPVLGDDAALELVGDELRYFEHRFPVAPGTVEPGDTADAVHDRQHYQLVHHSRGDSELSYRRFFTVTSLAGVRMEDPAVFEATHVRVREWVQQGVLGLRVDHPDGLVDPADYLTRLRALAPQAWITVEKILEPGEKLPDWPVQGSTGYDAMREVNGIFIDPAAEVTFTGLYQRLTRDRRSFADHAALGKRLAASELLVAEGRRMAALVPELEHVQDALVEIATAFEVYRSYLPEGVEYLDRAVATARQRVVERAEPEVAERIATIDALGPRLHDPQDELARRFQQFTGAVTAKGVEDTAYYRYSRFLALNEVGGDPDHFGLSLAEFHAAQQVRLADQPESMTSLSTHDTKRGEDVRARLAVLSEIGPEWAAVAAHLGSGDDFARFTAEHPAFAELNPAFEYLIRQTIVGAGLVDRDRIHAYVEKAIREAKDGTTWTSPNEPLEGVAHALVDRLYDDELVRDELQRLLSLIEQPGWANALGQKLVQLTMPGVPDVYQGTELWDDSLVDPDNRRPVDFAARRRLLAGLGRDQAPYVDGSGAAKLWVTRQALRLRRDRPELFGSYRPLYATGPAADHLLAYDRGGAVTLATRLPIRLSEQGGWDGTTLDLEQAMTDVLTARAYPAGQVAVAELLDHYPVALLVIG